MTEAVELKIEKLLRVADGTANENESATALQMAQKLADLHNLDIGNIGKSGARKDEQVSKGLYQYQRTLYTEIARLNHCKVWVTKGLTRGSKYQTRLLGSKVNVTVTKNLCDYIEEVTTRLVRDEYGAQRMFIKDAHIFREGVIEKLVDRIKDRRRIEEQEREAAKREQAARQSHPGAATENALVLMSDVAREEEKANYDYLNGEGAWDRIEARRMARQAEIEAAAREYDQWALDNPEAAAAKKAEQEAENAKWYAQYNKKQARLEAAKERRRQARIDEHGHDPEDWKTSKPTKYDSDAYWSGQSRGETVNLDDQIDHKTSEKLT